MQKPINPEEKLKMKKINKWENKFKRLLNVMDM